MLTLFHPRWQMRRPLLDSTIAGVSQDLARKAAKRVVVDAQESGRSSSSPSTSNPQERILVPATTAMDALYLDRRRRDLREHATHPATHSIAGSSSIATPLLRRRPSEWVPGKNRLDRQGGEAYSPRCQCRAGTSRLKPFRAPDDSWHCSVCKAVFLGAFRERARSQRLHRERALAPPAEPTHGWPLQNPNTGDKEIFTFCATCA